MEFLELDSDTNMATVIATCGHQVTFRVSPDKPMDQRIAKHRGRKCGPCRIADNDARIALGMTGPTRIKKGQEPKHLPSGTLITLRLGEDMTWFGDLHANGIMVVAQGTGLMGMASKLAKAWLKQTGHEVKK